MRNNLLAAALIGTFALASCQKTESLSRKTNALGTNAITPPTGFTWENSRNIKFTVSITDRQYGSSMFMVTIYDADPAAGGKVLAKGSATMSSSFVSEVYLSKQITSVYIVKTAPDNSSVTTKMVVGNADVTVSIGE